MLQIIFKNGLFKYFSNTFLKFEHRPAVLAQLYKYSRTHVSLNCTRQFVQSFYNSQAGLRCRKYMHKHIKAYIHARLHARKHTQTHTYACTTHPCMHTHSKTRAHVHTREHSFIDTHVL